MRVLRNRRVRREREVVPVEGRPVREVTGPQDRGRGRIGDRLVAPGELDDHRRGDVLRVGDRIRGVLLPLSVVEGRLDRGRAGDGVDAQRLVAKRLVLVERREARVQRLVVERRKARDERDADERAEAAEPCNLDDRPAWDVRHACADVRLQPEQLHAVDATEGLAGVVDPGRAQVARAVAVHVDAALEHAD
jgi:hypothetical protein